MVTALRVVLIALATLCLLVVGTWVAADHYATRWANDDLAQHGLAGLVEVDSVRLPLPNLVRATGVNLRDPLTGQIVAHVNQLELHFALNGLESLRNPRPEWIVGEGGRVTLSNSGGELSIARAVRELIQRESAWEGRQEAAPAAAPGAAPAPPSGVPRHEFRDIEALLQSPGTVLESVPGCRAWLDMLDHGVQLNIEAGATGGLLTLRFDSNGLSSLDVHALPVTPVYTLFLPDGGGEVASDFGPSGRLDLQLQIDADAGASGHGLLDDASLHLRGVPFPLDHARLPFEFGNGHFKVRDARVAFEGGVLTTSIDQTPEGRRVDVDVVDARFRKEYLDLLPQNEEMIWFRPEDGGNVEVHVQVDMHAGSEKREVRGWGGVLCDHVRLGPTGVDVEDVVGSFDIHGDRLLLHETSGRIASGVVRLQGQLDMQTGDVEGSCSVFDVDVSRLKGALSRGDSGPSSISGWLQGEVRYKGNLASPKDGVGDGDFSVRGGNLWKVPVLDKVISTLGYEDPGSAEEHRLEVKFRIHGLKYVVDEMRLESSYLSLLGSGKVSRDGEIEVDIIPISVPLGPIGDLLEYLQSQFVELEVRGTLLDPQARVVVIKGVTHPLGALFSFVSGLFGGDQPAASDASEDSGDTTAAAPAGSAAAAGQAGPAEPAAPVNGAPPPGSP